jgi:hypothetical protein
LPGLKARWTHSPLIVKYGFFFFLAIVIVGLCAKGISYLSAPGDGVVGPRYLRWFEWKRRRISWWMRNAGLDMSSGNSEVAIEGFKVNFRVNRGKAIWPTVAFIEDVNGSKVDLFVDTGPRPALPSDIGGIPIGFTSYLHGRIGPLTREQFLARWAPMKLRVDFTDGTRFQREFSRSELITTIDRYQRSTCGPKQPIGWVKDASGK